MSLRNQVIQWNLKFPLDRVFRKQHNIIFGSPEHKALNQIDIYFSYYEDLLYKELYEEVDLDLKKKKEFEKDIWLGDYSDPFSQEDEVLFEKLRSKIKEM